MSRHASSLDLMRKSGPHQSASGLLYHLYTNLRHILGLRERQVVDSLEIWGKVLEGIPSPSQVVDVTLMGMAQTIDRLGLTLKNVTVTPKIWRAEYKKRQSRTDPKVKVEDKGSLSTNYLEDELTSNESLGTERLYVPGTANGADVYMLFQIYGSVGDSPVHRLYRDIADYCCDLYLTSPEEMLELSTPGGIELLIKTARAGFASMKDVKQVAALDAIGAEIMLRRGNAFSALKHAVSITGDEHNVERKIALKAAESLVSSVESLASSRDFEGANALMARLLQNFPYVTQFHSLQVRLLDMLCKAEMFAEAYDIVQTLRPFKHVREFDGLMDKIETAEAEAQNSKISQQKEIEEEEKKLAVEGFAEARKELGDLALKDDLGEALLKAQNMLPRFEHSPDCKAEIEEFIKNLEDVIEESAKSTDHLTLEQLGKKIQVGLQSSTFGEKLASTIMANQTLPPANDQTSEVTSEEKEPELIERAVMEDGRTTAVTPEPEKVEETAQEVIEAIADDAEQAEAEEATG